MARPVRRTSRCWSTRSCASPPTKRTANSRSSGSGPSGRPADDDGSGSSPPDWRSPSLRRLGRRLGAHRRQQRQAVQSAVVADASRLGALARSTGDYDRALLLAAQAVKLNPSPGTQSDLFATLLRGDAVVATMRSGPGELRSLFTGRVIHPRSDRYRAGVAQGADGGRQCRSLIPRSGGPGRDRPGLIVARIVSSNLLTLSPTRAGSFKRRQ